MLLVSITLRRNDTAPIDRSGYLLYDSDCGICLATAAWLAKRVVPSRLGLLALSDADSVPRIGRLVRGRPLTTTIHFVRADDTILTGARAVIAAAAERHLPFTRRVAMMELLVEGPDERWHGHWRINLGARR